MSVLLNPVCPASCEGVLVPVDFDLCAPEVHYAEVLKIYLAAVDAADFTNIELLPEWTARLSETSVDPDAIRPLTVLGDLQVAEQTEITISGNRIIVGAKQFTLTFEVDETNSINYNLLLTSECNLTFKMWFRTSDGMLYGGNEGIIASLRLNLMIPRERADVVKYMGTLKWKSVFSPLLSLSPISGGVIPMSAGETAIRAGNTVAWYDYTDATTLTDDGGGLISSWRDKLLGGTDLTAVAGARPLLTADGILFDGADDRMSTGAFVYAQPEMIYLVVKVLSWTFGDKIGDGFASNSGAIYQAGVTPQVFLYAGSGAAGNTDLVLNVFHIVRVCFKPIFGTLQVDENVATSGDNGANNMGGITIGSNGAGDDGWSEIEVKEAIYRDVADSAGDQAAIYAYLKAKYGL